jgi:hypothetical protein
MKLLHFQETARPGVFNFTQHSFTIITSNRAYEYQVTPIRRKQKDQYGANGAPFQTQVIVQNWASAPSNKSFYFRDWIHWRWSHMCGIPVELWLPVCRAYMHTHIRTHTHTHTQARTHLGMRSSHNLSQLPDCTLPVCLKHEERLPWSYYESWSGCRLTEIC